MSVAGDIAASPETLVAQWKEAGITAVLMQYVPFLYGRRGLSSWPGRFADAARRRGVPVLLFVHEPWVPPTRLPWLVLSPLQRRQLRRLARRVTRSVTPVPAWQELLRPSPALHYVGSTLGDAPRDTLEPPLEAPVVFSPFGAGLNWGWILRAADAIGAAPALIVLGATEAEARNHPAMRGWFRPGWSWRGRLTAADTLATLARARIVLAPFVDGLTGRRTSAAAALSAGAPLVSSLGPLFDQAFREAPLDLAQDAAEFGEMAARRWAEPDSAALRRWRLEWYDRHLDSRMLDDRLLAMLTGPAA